MFAALMARAQNDPVPADDAGAGDPPHAANREPQVTMFDHPANHSWLLSGQANIIFQANPPIHSPYEGTNSFLAIGEYKTSLVGTVFTGLQLHRNLRYNTDAIFDLESSGGRGLSKHWGWRGSRTSMWCETRR